ncbi:DNA polymerase III subunit gamma and tau, partial [Streptomyces polyrhachis]
AAPAPASQRPAQAAAPSAAPPDSGAVQPGAASARRMWPDILEAVKNKRRFTWILLSQNAFVSGFDGSTLQLGFGSPGARDSFAGGGSAEVVQEVLAESFGVRWKVEAIVDLSGGAGAPAPAAAPAPSAAMRRAAQAAPPASYGEAPAAPRPEARTPPPAPYESYAEPEPPPPPPEEDMPAHDDRDLDDSALAGHDLIVRELGATVVEEIPHN